MSRSRRATSTPEALLPLWSGRVVLAAALWCFVATLLPGKGWRDLVDAAFTVVGVPTAPNYFLALVLLVEAAALRRGLRVGWWVAVVVLGLQLVVAALAFAAVVLGMLDELDGTDLALFAVATLTSCLFLALFVRRRVDFPAIMRSGSLWRAVLTLAAGLLGVVVVVFLLSWLSPGRLQSDEHLWYAIRSVTGLSAPQGVSDQTHGPHWLANLASLLAAGVLLLALWGYIQSAQRAELQGPQDELRLRRLLALHGDQDSLGYFATRRDKSTIFSADGHAAVSYRVIGAICLASGDPIGPPEAWPRAIAAWREQARIHAWTPGVLSASEAGARAYVAAGLTARPLGDEAVVRLDDFTLEGRAMRPVKRAVARVRSAGCTVEVSRHCTLDPKTSALLVRCAERWRGQDTERGFSMALGRLGDRSDGRCVAVVVRDGDGQVVAFQSYVPWGTRGLSLDVMRRSPQAPNGVNEAMVAALAEAAPSLGVRRASLNFAMFRSVFTDADKVGAGVGVRVADRILSWGNRFWQLESLYEANAKYHPRWETRYVCFEGVASLPQLGIASGVAEGFLPGRAPQPVVTGETPVQTEEGVLPLADAVARQDEQLLHPPRPTRHLTEQQRIRHGRLDILRAAGMDPYPVAVARTHSIADARALGAGAVSITGRVRAIRSLGGVTFAVLEERGERLQALLERDVLDPGAWVLWQRAVDVGDHVSVTGTLGTSRSGEPSVLVTSWAMASKSLRPIPSSRTGFRNPEARVRQRYLDLVVNADSMAMLRARSRAVAAIRAAFTTRGYTEVETPMLQTIHGGASARPFRTHINAYDADLYLRIAPELFLKQLCVGGMDRVFELNRNFRNEGADATHNPEFTSVEAYAAHGDYTSMRLLTRALVLEVATAVHGEPVAVRDGQRVRLDHDWPVVTVHDAVSRTTGTVLTSSTPLEQVRAVADAHGIRWTDTTTAGEIVVELYDELVEGQTTLPTFYTDFPLETSPLTRPHRTDPRLSERWDLVAWGAEIGTAYSELVDPVDQRTRLTEQSYKAAAGDPEAMEVDEGFLTALEYAMPPTGGLGIGVDRLVMMLTGTSIRATLAFPFTRPTT